MTVEQEHRRARVREKLAIHALSLDEKTFDKLLLMADYEVRDDAKFDGEAVAEWVPKALTRIKDVLKAAGRDDEPKPSPTLENAFRRAR